MTWRLAESLKKLREQLNTAFPKRSKISDGSIGDASHSARTSDHNPNEKGVVCAIDVTNDPATGVGGQWLADTLVRNKDPRIKYIIWNKQICSSQTSPWKWRPYHGVNAHQHHVHISVKADQNSYDSRAVWKLDFPVNGKSDVAKVSAVTSPTAQTLTGELGNPTEDSNSPLESNSGVTADTTTIKETVVEETPAGGTVTETTTTVGEPVTVKAVAMGVWSKVVAAIAGLSALGINAGTIVETKLSEISLNQVFMMALGVALLIVTMFYVKKRQEAADLKTHLLIEAAADKDKHTIHLTK